MHRFLTLLLICSVSTCLASAQLALAPVKFSTFRHPAPGYYLFAPNSPDSLALVDHSGKPIFAVRAVNSANLQQADSTITHFDADGRSFVRRNVHMQVVDTMKLSGGYAADYHEGHMLANGNYVVLGSEIRIIDMSAVVPGGNSAARVVGAVFQERTLTGQTVFEWKSLDHIPVTDATENIELFQSAIDYIHVNAIVEDTDGNFLVSCRHLDEILKIHRKTGNVIWRWGGSKSKNNQFTFLNDNVGFVGFSHQHDISRTAAGRLLMMDNGNLKPVKFSRAAEYELDETLKTAKLTWSFRASPDLYAPGMGSTQELENGNILIGWGLASKLILAHEVSRDGIVQAEIHTVNQAIPTYRVRKAVFAMSGAERAISSPGTYSFTRGDSTTHITIEISRADASTSVITERHSLAPHNIEFTSSAPCSPLPMRWVIRVKDTSKIAGSTRFALGGLPMVLVPLKVKLYHRPTEGSGKFSEVAYTFNSTSSTLVMNSILPGEYMLGFPMCYDPVPATPASAAVHVSLSPALSWSEGLQTEGYDVEVSLASNPVPLISFRTLRLDTTVSGLMPGVLYAWRVRARRPNPGPWSAVYTFRTRLATPTGVAPNSLPDSIAVDTRPVFTWTSSVNASKYRLQVFRDGIANPVIDTIVGSTSFQLAKPFEFHAWYRWQVRAQLDTQSSVWSAQLAFITVPNMPLLLSPRPEELEIDTDRPVATWKPVTGGIGYHVQLFVDAVPDAFYEDTVQTSEATFPALVPVARYFWRARTISRYGVSDWTAKQWFLTRGATALPAPILINPVGTQNVDTMNTQFTWTPIDEATYYHVQITSKAIFTNPDIEWRDLIGNVKVVPKLLSGHAYQWRVMALSDVASGRWSSTGRFTTLPGPNDALRPLTPANGSVDVPIQSSVTFVTDSRFTTYRAEFSTTDDFARIEHSIEGAISPLPYTLTESTMYWWRVVGMRNSIEVDTGATAGFVTISPTSVYERTSPAEQPRIEVQGSNLEVTGDLGGSRIQLFNLLGKLVSVSDVPAGLTYWSQSLVDLPATPHIIVVVTSHGGVARATFFVQNSGL